MLNWGIEEITYSLKDSSVVWDVCNFKLWDILDDGGLLNFFIKTFSFETLTTFFQLKTTIVLGSPEQLLIKINSTTQNSSGNALQRVNTHPFII